MSDTNQFKPVTMALTHIATTHDAQGLARWVGGLPDDQVVALLEALEAEDGERDGH